MCSRREADALIAAGKVTINNVIAQLGNRVLDGDTVTVNGKMLQQKPKTIYIALNKPVGIVSTTDLKEPKNIIDFVNHPQRLFPIGRLDKPSEGLIFLTNDGDIVNKILRAGNAHSKEYFVTVAEKISDEFILKMANGIPILGTVTKKCVVQKLSNFQFKIILTQGLNRQIRRMCAFLGYNVTKLKRTRIMNISLDKLKPGEWRYLSDLEINEMNTLVAHSSKTEEASVDFKKKVINNQIKKFNKRKK